MQNLKQGGTTNTKPSSMKNKQTKNKIPEGDRIQSSQLKKKQLPDPEKVHSIDYYLGVNIPFPELRYTKTIGKGVCQGCILSP